MLPSKTPFAITKASAGHTNMMTLKLPEDLARKLQMAPSGVLRLHLDSTDPSQNKLILADETVLPLTVAPEPQIVDVARSNPGRRTLQIVGRVTEKLAVKQELASEKASAIRRQTELAEKERLARKYTISTVAIEAPSKNGALSAVRTTKATLSAGANSRSRLMQRISGQKKAASAGIASPRIPARKTVPSDTDRSSTQSWSPTIDVFAKPEPDTKPKLEPIMVSVADDLRYRELAGRFQQLFGRYSELEKWVDRRLAIFEQLQKDLDTTKTNQPATERITKRVALETEQLKSDREYKWKLAEMDQLKGQLESLRSQMAALPAHM